jgi:hypothetical protein
MTFPTGNQVVTTELSTGTGSPSLAREQLYLLAVWFNELLESANQASGVCVLNGAGQIDSTQLPGTFAPTTLTLAPTDGNVKIEDVLRLQIIPKADLIVRPNCTIGDLALAADDLTGANAKLCAYNGTVWKIIATLSTATTLT